MRSLYFTVWAAPLWCFDLPLQFHTVCAISAAVPTARTICLYWSVEWRWRSGAGEWEPVLIPRAPPQTSACTSLKALLYARADPRVRVRDSGGVLARLLDAGDEEDALCL